MLRLSPRLHKDHYLVLTECRQTAIFANFHVTPAQGQHSVSDIVLVVD